MTPRVKLPDAVRSVLLRAIGSSVSARVTRLVAVCLVGAAATISGATDGFVAARVALLALAGVLLGTASRPAWLLELGPLAVIVAALWVKLVFATGVIVSGWQPMERTVVGATAVGLLLMFAPFMWMPRAWRMAAALASSGVLSMLLLADVLHLRFYREVVSIAEVSSAGQIHGVVNAVFELLGRSDLLIFADLLGMLALMPLYLRAGARVPLLPARARLAAGAAGLALAAVAAVPTVRMMARDPDLVFEYATTRTEVIAAVGVFPYHLYDLGVTLLYPVRGRLTVGAAELDRVQKFLDELRATAPAPSDVAGVATGKNLILVQLESLNAFPLGLTVDGQEVTPHLSALAKESLRFGNFYDQTYMGTTSDSEFSSQQSLHPLPGGAVATRYPSNQYRALAAILRDRGYRTMSTVGSAGEFWNVRQMHRALGYQQSFFVDSFRPGERFWIWVPDTDLFEQSVPRMAGEREPFMAYLATSSLHYPFKLPERYQSLNLGWLRGSIVGDYLDSVHYVDAAVGLLVGRLRAAGLLDRSVLVLFGDHRANLGEQPELARLLGFSPSTRHGFWRARKTLPLLIRLPGGAHAGERRVAGGHLDIAPTLLRLLGIEEPHTVMFGRDLTADHRGFVVFREGGFVDGDEAFVVGPGIATCYRTPAGTEIDCGPLEAKNADALERLRLSDYVIEGNLIPELLRLGAASESFQAADTEQPSPD